MDGIVSKFTGEKQNIARIIPFILIIVFIISITSGKVYAYSNAANLTSGINVDILIILILIVGLIIVFFLEPVRIDIIALAVPIVLVFLKPWTNITTEDALSGFSNKATITILAMFILSKGIQQNGFIHILGNKIAEVTGENEKKQLITIVVLAGITACFLNNTPVVAIFIPMVMDLSRKTKSSPSKLLIPLSYASMMGGMMTLIGTSTNLLASDISERILDNPFSMFEFTKLGVVILITGIIYLITVGYYLTPKRRDPNKELTDEYKVEDYLTEIVIPSDSQLIGETMEDVIEERNINVNILQIVRSNFELVEPLSSKILEENDKLLIKTDKKTLLELVKTKEIQLLPKMKITTEKLEKNKRKKKLIEIIIPSDSFLEGKSLKELNFLKQFKSIVLAIKRGSSLSYDEIENLKLKSGDMLLILGDKSSVKELKKKDDPIIVDKVETEDFNKKKMMVSLAILLLVIFLAALGITSIVVSSLLGVIIMIITGCIKPTEIYDAVNWQVIFLLAGLIPLGIAIEKTGTAHFMANKLINITSSLPNIIILGIFYLFTAALTNLISNNASVILMIPVAINAAEQIGANPYAFVLAVTFAASTAFLTPVGYQTNLMVYSPGGYHFRDYVKVGLPLQILLSIVTPIFISIFWGI